MRRPVSILYVLGRGRSGSTVFANVLGEHAGCVSAGEVRYLWDPVVRNNSECSCGNPITTCEVWSRVLGMLSDVNVEDAAAWQREVVKERNLVKIVRYRRDGSWPALENFVHVMARVYEALAEVTGSDVIVDSSKRPSYAAVVRLIDTCQPYFVQLVRDPRASAYSWGHRRHLSVLGDREVTRRGALDSTIRWNILNLESELLLRRVDRHKKLTLRYEDFVTAPRTRAREVMALLGRESAESPFLDEATVQLSTNHTVGGNPSRYEVGELKLRDNREWCVRQSAVDRWAATVLALPFLPMYRYPLRVHSR